MRGDDGAVAAIGNICPHRFASVSQGRFENGIVECPYHGLRFDMRGQCVRNPHGDGRIAERARVPGFPLVERHGALWIWLGADASADPATIPDLSLLETPSAEDRASGYLHTRANYQLLCDNIMDLSHADFVHRSSLGTGGERAEAQARARVREDTVVVGWSFDGKGMMIQRPLRNGAEVTTRMEVTWVPAGVMIIRSEIGPIGGGAPATRKAGVHIMPPETATTTHYFFENGEAERKQMLALALDVFDREDDAMLEEVQRNMGGGEFWALAPLILSNDKGAVLSRRVLRRVIRQERDHGTGAPACEGVEAGQVG